MGSFMAWKEFYPSYLWSPRKKVFISFGRLSKPPPLRVTPPGCWSCWGSEGEISSPLHIPFTQQQEAFGVTGCSPLWDCLLQVVLWQPDSPPGGKYHNYSWTSRWGVCHLASLIKSHHVLKKWIFAKDVVLTFSMQNHSSSPHVLKRKSGREGGKREESHENSKFI